MNPNPNPNKALWEKGDFTRIAETMRDSGESVVKSLGITKGMKVLDEFRTYYGPTMNAFAAAEQNGKAADLERELVTLFERENRGRNQNTTSIPATFLRVTVVV